MCIMNFWKMCKTSFDMSILVVPSLLALISSSHYFCYSSAYSFSLSSMTMSLSLKKVCAIPFLLAFHKSSVLEKMKALPKKFSIAALKVSGLLIYPFFVTNIS